MSILIVIIWFVLLAVVKRAKNKTVKRYAAVSLGASMTLAMLYGWIITAPPSFNSLSSISGEITESAPRNSRTANTDFKIDKSDLVFSYINWYPNFDEVVRSLKVGNTVTIWYDPQENEATISVWAVQNDGMTLVDYKTMLSARNDNRNYWFVLVIFLGLATIYFSRKSVWEKSP